MRFCENEAPAVYETTGNELSTLLREAADQLDSLDDVSWAGVNVGACPDGAGDIYLLTLYVH